MLFNILPYIKMDCVHFYIIFHVISAHDQSIHIMTQTTNRFGIRRQIFRARRGKGTNVTITQEGLNMNQPTRPHVLKSQGKEKNIEERNKEGAVAK